MGVAIRDISTEIEFEPFVQEVGVRGKKKQQIMLYDVYNYCAHRTTALV